MARSEISECDPIPINVGEYTRKTPELFTKSDLTDLTIVVEESELHFVKYPLMAASSVFTKLIKESEDQSQLKLDDVQYDDMVLFLECLHPKMLQSVTDMNLESVATIAHRFQHEGVLKKCEEYIVEQMKIKRIPKDGMYPKFFFHMRLADNCGLAKAVQEGLLSKKVQMAYFNSKYLKEDKVCEGYRYNQDFENLSLERKFEILQIRLTKAEEMINPRNPY